MTLLEVRDLTAGYGPAEVLHGVSLRVEEAEIVVVLGANGAGKTTTMRAIAGLIGRKGTVNLDGASIIGLSPDKVVAAGVSLVPQGRGTFAKLSVDDNLHVGAAKRRDRQGIKEDLARCTRSSRCSRHAASRWPAPSQVANSRCSPSPGRL